MHIQWETKVGPASIIGALGIIIQVIVVIWVGATIYTKTTDKIEAQSAKIDEVAKGSDRRFQTVRNSMASALTTQAATADRVSRVETAVGFIKDQVQQLVSKVDGK